MHALVKDMSKLGAVLAGMTMDDSTRINQPPLSSPAVVNTKWICDACQGWLWTWVLVPSLIYYFH